MNRLLPIVMLAIVVLAGYFVVNAIRLSNEITEMAERIETIQKCIDGDEKSCSIIEQYPDYPDK